MIKLKDILNETFINVFTPKEKQSYVEEVWDILQRSYSKIGGFKTASNPQELINKSWLWKMNRKNGKIISVRIYKDKNGRKSIAAGTDGSYEGKKSLMGIIEDDIKLNRSWGEVSGAMERIAIDKFNAQPVPNIFASKILDKEIIEYNSDGYHYTRMIGGEKKEKIILVGNNVGDFVKKFEK